MEPWMIACIALLLVCIGLVLYILLRPTQGKSHKSIFDVGYNHMADNAPQIPEDADVKSTENDQTPLENDAEIESEVENNEKEAE